MKSTAIQFISHQCDPYHYPQKSFISVRIFTTDFTDFTDGKRILLIREIRG
jgi:hypothetical protein